MIPQTKFQKLLQGKLVKNFIAPFIRGAVKQIPFVGNPISEIITNMAQPKTMMAVTTDNVAGAIEVVKPPKHSYVSIIVQSVLAVCVIYAFWTKAITIQDVVLIVKGLFGIE